MNPPGRRPSLVDLLQAPRKWWVIEIEPGHERVMAEVFEHPRGIIFADIGWSAPANPTHPFHVIEGELVADGAEFRIGPARIFEIDEGHPLAYDWMAWLFEQGGPEARAASREACARAIQASGLLQARPGGDLSRKPE